MTPKEFGETPEGNSVHQVTISGDGMTASLLTWGAILQDLRMDGYAHPLVLGYDNFPDYLHHSPYFGATAGRFANRIGYGSFEIDGQTHNTDQNFFDKHTLHGGSAGIGKRLWEIDNLTESSVTLRIEDPDGAMGFPGNAVHQCLYSLHDDGILRVEFQSTCDAPSPVSLAHHSYFTLDNARDCRTTELQISADSYLPVNDELIPLGRPENVSETPFDFRTSKLVGHDIDGDFIYDHNWCLSNERTELRKVAEARAPQNGLSLAVHTTEPGLQFYAGHKLNTPVPGLTGSPYGPYAGFALETQIWPDAPNQNGYPDAILRPGEVSRQITEYRFSQL